MKSTSQVPGAKAMLVQLMTEQAPGATDVRNVPPLVCTVMAPVPVLALSISNAQSVNGSVLSCWKYYDLGSSSRSSE